MRGLSGAKGARERGQKPQGAAHERCGRGREGGEQPKPYWGRNGRMGMLATRPGRTHRWSFREDADGLTPRLNLPARIGEVERAREVDTTGAKGDIWSPKAGLGKVSEVWAFKRPYTGPRGSKG